MNRKYIFSLAAAAIGSTALAVTAANAFGGHGGHHHGSPAARACIAVMTPDQRSNLKSIFSDAKSTLMMDHQKVESAKQDLEVAIFTKGSDLNTPENNLSAAKLKMLQDQDAAAVKVCGLLNAKQLSAAEDLYKNLVALRQSTHEQARDYFKKARTAAGDPTTSDTQAAPQSAE
jgi:hypothetical protein